jgi:hypothetical protein
MRPRRGSKPGNRELVTGSPIVYVAPVGVWAMVETLEWLLAAQSGIAQRLLIC